MHEPEEATFVKEAIFVKGEAIKAFGTCKADVICEMGHSSNDAGITLRLWNTANSRPTLIVLLLWEAVKTPGLIQRLFRDQFAQLGC
jgi:hypothetical protein